MRCISFKPALTQSQLLKKQISQSLLIILKGIQSMEFYQKKLQFNQQILFIVILNF